MLMIDEGINGIEWKTNDWPAQVISPPVSTKQSF